MFSGKRKYTTIKPGPSAGKVHVPEGAWMRCPQCSTVLYQKSLEQNLGVCEKCGFHFRIGAWERIHQLVDVKTPFEEFDVDLPNGNPLGFPGYTNKKEQDTKKTGLHDAVVTGLGSIDGHSVVLGIMDFDFVGGSMGAVVGEKITRAFEYATRARLPVVLVSSSGGARMQEAIISLVQMQKTVAAVESHSQAGLLSISVLADPTMAGVYGSFASQGDINIAEPGATIGFAGPDVIEAAIHRRVPSSLQKAETVYRNGFVDEIVPRTRLKHYIGKLLAFHDTALA